MARAPIHPGEILADELQEIGVTPTELSRQIDVPANRIAQIIHGRRGVTGDTALRLGHWFGTSAQFWLNLQSAYNIRSPRKRLVAKSRGCRCAPTSKARPGRVDRTTVVVRGALRVSASSYRHPRFTTRCAPPSSPP